MRMTATDAMEVHAKLLPISQQVQNHCHQAILCIAAHPPTQPLHPTIWRAAYIYVKHHHSSLHQLTHTFNVNPSDIETV
ncbi:hypothetical protein PAXRUDRAFT_71103, partial [Paxillus rubicundulus Ve08.2h10]